MTLGCCSGTAQLENQRQPLNALAERFLSDVDRTFARILERPFQFPMVSDCVRDPSGNAPNVDRALTLLVEDSIRVRSAETRAHCEFIEAT